LKEVVAIYRPVLATSPVNIAHSEVCNACKVLFVKAANAHHNLI